MAVDITLIPDVAMAVAHAAETARPKEAICIAGSLYVVGEAKEALGSKFKGSGFPPSL
jgi:dihydrofolate synthase/folylpolyglutamate synthase